MLRIWKRYLLTRLTLIIASMLLFHLLGCSGEVNKCKTDSFNKLASGNARDRVEAVEFYISKGEQEFSEFARVLGSEQSARFLLKNWKRVKEKLTDRELNMGYLPGVGPDTPLTVAAEKGYLEAVKLITDKQEVLGTVSPLERNWAFLKAVRQARENVVRFMLHLKVDINFKPELYPVTPLHDAMLSSNVNLVRMLIEAGADVNGRDSTGLTPLHWAAARSPKAIIETLIVKGAEVNARNRKYYMPIHLAVISNTPEVVRFLIDNGAKLKSPAEFDEELIESEFGENRYFGESIFRTFEDKWDLLHFAAYRGDVKVIEIILSKSAKVSKRSTYGYTPLHLASARGRSNAVSLLLEHGADINSCDKKEGMPSLHFATIAGDEETMAVLLDHGAKIDAKTSSGRTVLFSALEFGTRDTLEYLISKRADVFATDEHGDTLLHLVAELDRVELLQYFVEKGIDINVPNLYGETPLHKAAAEGNIQAVRHLLKMGSELTVKDEDGEIPIDKAKTDEIRQILENAGK